MIASVIMPVYNASAYLKESVLSVLEQSFSDFELILLEDGSTDDSLKILQSFNDSRIRLIRSETNKGLVWQLNEGLRLAKGKYIIRMDADDICLPHRFRKQINFMESNPDIGISGTWVHTFGAQHWIWKVRLNDDDIRFNLLLGCPFAHFSIIARRQIFEENQLSYNKTWFPVEDYHLWWRLLEFTKAANLPEVLTKYRVHEHQISDRLSNEQLQKSSALKQLIFKNYFFEIATQDKKYYDILLGNIKCAQKDLKGFDAFLSKMILQNKSRMKVKSLEKNLDRILLMRIVSLKKPSLIIAYLYHSERRRLRFGLLFNTVLAKLRLN